MARSVSSGNYLTKSTSADVGGVGSVFIRIKPSWSSGDSSAHYVWDYENVTFELSFQKYLDNNIYAGYNIISGADARIVLSDAGLFSSGTWGNWLLDWDDTADLTHIYLNNVLKGTSSSTFTVSTGATTVRVGRGLAADRPLDADVAEFARWDHVLDSTERATLESTGNPACLSTGLLHHYKILGDDSPEPDEVGAEDLTLVGSPAQATHPTVGSCGTTYTLTADAGTYALTGQTAATKVNATLTAAQGSYALTGQTAVTSVTARLTAAVGSYALTGMAAVTKAVRNLIGAVGSYALAGQAAATTALRAIAAATGYYTLTGQNAAIGDATLTAGIRLTTSIGTVLNLTPSAGSVLRLTVSASLATRQEI